MQQVIHPLKEPLHAKLIMPGSKSLSLRALLLAALAEGVSEISDLLICEETKTFIQALHQLGIVTQLDEKARSCIIAGGAGKFPNKQATINCHHSLLITQFLITACAATSGVYFFDGSDRLHKQLLSQLIAILIRQGVQFIPSDVNKLPLTMMGSDTLEGGEILFDNSTPSQIISSLLMIAPYARSPFTFKILSKENNPYIEMTCTLMAEFGVLVHRISQGQLLVPTPQRYQARDYAIEPHFSIAAYFFAAAAVTGGEITIQSVNPLQSKQIDAKFLSVLEKMGCHLQQTPHGFTLKGPKTLNGVEVSMKEFAHTFTALIGIAPFAQSPTRIAHIGTLQQKELDRLMAVKTIFTKIGIQVETGNDWIKIFPATPLGGIINSFHDYHLAMGFSLLGLKSPGVIIDHAECVNKIYPDFFTLWQKLGENTSVQV